MSEANQTVYFILLNLGNQKAMVNPWFVIKFRMSDFLPEKFSVPEISFGWLNTGQKAPLQIENKPPTKMFQACNYAFLASFHAAAMNKLYMIISPVLPHVY